MACVNVLTQISHRAGRLRIHRPIAPPASSSSCTRWPPVCWRQFFDGHLYPCVRALRPVANHCIPPLVELLFSSDLLDANDSCASFTSPSLRFISCCIRFPSRALPCGQWDPAIAATCGHVLRRSDLEIRKQFPHLNRPDPIIPSLCSPVAPGLLGVTSHSCIPSLCLFASAVVVHLVKEIVIIAQNLCCGTSDNFLGGVFTWLTGSTLFAGGKPGLPYQVCKFRTTGVGSSA